jgi:hypothetical protein
MSFFEWLRDGSVAHVVRPLARGFRIVPADPDSDAIREQFHRIVEEALEYAAGCGYELTLLHRSSVDPKHRWDSAVVTEPWLDRSHLVSADTSSSLLRTLFDREHREPGLAGPSANQAPNKETHPIHQTAEFPDRL